MAVTLPLPAIYYFLNLKVDSNHNLIIPDNGYNDFNTTEGKYTFNVSGSTIYVLNNIIKNADYNSFYLNEQSIISLVADTDLANTHTGINEFLRLVVLDSWVLNYILLEDQTVIQYITVDDLENTRMNIKFLCTFFGGYRKYRFLIEYLRSLEISIGYAENKINLILNNSDLRYAIDGGSD